MRYTVLVKNAQMSVVEKRLLELGATGITKAPNVNQMFCEATEEIAEKLKQIPGVVVNPVRIIRPAAAPPIEVRPASVISALVAMDAVTQAFGELRSFYAPMLTGVGLTVAVLDTGIRKTHVSLRGKVVYEYNSTDSESYDDIWGHGTGTAYLICGGDNGNEHVGVSPGARVMNIKVLNDDGIGSDETIVHGINKVIDLVKDARFQGFAPTNEMYPNTINISIGGEDDGNVDDPIRVACRTAIIDWGIDVIAAAGNSGPDRSTIMVPAAEPLVVAVGGTDTGTVSVWDKSSRGPTLLGDTKPDFMAWSTDLVLASNKSDDGYDVKSGTSFSAPIIAGLGGLMGETLRMQMDPFTAQMYSFRWIDAEAYAPYFCTKPAQGAAIKDNTYGFGSPAPDVMIQQVSQPSGTEDIFQMMPMVMIMGMLGGMI
jgi:serine protease AprX